MKHFVLTIYYALIISVAFAQPSQLEQDTITANKYLQQAKNLEDGSADKIALIEKAVTLCEHHDIPKKIIVVNSELTYQYAKAKSEKTMKIGQKNIDFAKAKFNDDKLPELGLTYFGMQKYLMIEDFEASGNYGEIALESLPKGSRNYFFVATNLIQLYVMLGEDTKLESIIRNVREIIKNNQANTAENAQFTLYFGLFMYNYLYENDELLIKYGKQVIIEIDENNIEYNKVLFYEQIGLSYNALGQMQKGIEWISKLKNNDDEISGNLDYFYNMAILYFASKYYKKSIPFFQKSITIYENENNTDYDSYLRDLYEDIGFCYIKTAQYKQAEKHLLKAYEYEQPYEPYIVDIYYAMLLNKRQQYDKGLNYIQKALVSVSLNLNDLNTATNPTKFDEFDSDSFAALALKTKAELLLNQYKKSNDVVTLSLARQTAKLAIDLLIEAQSRNRGYEANRFTLNINISETIQILQDIEYEQYKISPTSEQLNILFKTTEEYKALSLLENLAPEKLPEAILEEEKQLINTVRELEQRLAFLDKSAVDSIKSYQKKLTQATHNLDVFQAKLLKQYPKQITSGYYFKSIDITTLQSSLSEKSLWIEYAYNADNTLLYIYSISKTTVDLETIAITDSFFNNIQELKQLLKDPLSIQTATQKKFIETSYQLYNKLLASLDLKRKDIETLYVVPEQTLFNIPFEVLLSDNTIKPYESLDYVIKKYGVAYHYSATIFSMIQSKETIKDQSLLAFAPVFANNSRHNNNRLRSTNDSTYQAVERGDFVPLPYSKTEIETINKVITTNKSVILLEQQATKKNIINTLEKQSYQYVHLATHGLVNFENYKLSALACYGDNAESLLFVNEISRLDIDVDLIVLSSCESGIGRLIGSEGLIALNRSFIDAGAKNVLFSLWKVNDRYTSELMIKFYENQKENPEYTTALRLAKLELLDNPKSALPRFWAPFVLIGQ